MLAVSLLAATVFFFYFSLKKKLSVIAVISARVYICTEVSLDASMRNFISARQSSAARDFQKPE